MLRCCVFSVLEGHRLRGRGLCQLKDKVFRANKNTAIEQRRLIRRPEFTRKWEL